MASTRKELSDAEVDEVFRDLGLATEEQRRALLRSLSPVESAEWSETQFVIRLGSESEPAHEERDEQDAQLA
jgi:hypothetical protein